MSTINAKDYKQQRMFSPLKRQMGSTTISKMPKTVKRPCVLSKKMKESLSKSVSWAVVF